MSHAKTKVAVSVFIKSRTYEKLFPEISVSVQKWGGIFDPPFTLSPPSVVCMSVCLSVCLSVCMTLSLSF